MPLSSTAVDGRARSLRLLLLDVDGVLTDGTISVSAEAPETKPFFIRDGLALVWAQQFGLQVGLLSGRHSESTTRRAKELGISLVFQGDPNKRDVYERILAAEELRNEHVAYMGDDLLDLPVLGRAGLSAAPADAVPDVRAHVHWVSQYPGGRGAVRELVEVILRARGRWDGLVRSFLA